MTNYEKILKIKVFNFEDICNLTGNVNTSKSLIKVALEKNHIKRIKHNLYVVLDLENGKPLGNQYMIGSKITTDSYISYRSALDYYAKLKKVPHIVQVSSKRKFEKIRFNGYSYRYYSNGRDFGLSNIKGIKITNKERTLIDCVNKIDFAGGEAHLLDTLERLGKLNGDKLLEYLRIYDSKALFQRVGFIVEFLNYVFDIDREVIDHCFQRSGRTIRYFNNNYAKGENYLVARWKLRTSKCVLSRGANKYW